MGGGKCSDKLKVLMSNRRKMTQNCWIFGAARRSDEEAGKNDEAAGKSDEEAGRSDEEAGRR